MALLNAGTKTTTNLKAIQWQPAGMNQTDLAALMALIKNPTANVSYDTNGYIENGFLFLPAHYAPQGLRLQAGDYICVDALGWPILVNGTAANAAGTSWNNL